MPYNPKYNPKSYEYAKTHLKRVPLDIQITYFEEVLKPAAEAAGERLNTYIKKAIQMRIDEENSIKTSRNDDDKTQGDDHERL